MKEKINAKKSISLLKNAWGSAAQVDDVEIIMELAQKMEEGEIADFLRDSTLTDSYGYGFKYRPDLMDYAARILEASDKHTLLGVAKNKYTFGRVDRFRYGATPQVVSRWGLKGFEKVSGLGWKVTKHLGFGEGLDAAGSFFNLAGSLGGKKSLKFLDEKVKGLIAGCQRKERRNEEGDEYLSNAARPIVGEDYCGACVRKYFEGDNWESLHYTRSC